MTSPESAGRRAVIAEIWSVLLNCPVDDDTNFFEVGGNSISAIRALARLGDVAAVDVPLRVLFAHPTVAELARYIDELDGEDAVAGGEA